MSLTELSLQGLQEGVEAHFERRSVLNTYEDRELEIAMGSSLKEKEDQGFTHMMIVHKIYALFFLSQENEIQLARRDFIQRKGGTGNVEFYLIERTGEIVVLMK